MMPGWLGELSPTPSLGWFKQTNKSIALCFVQKWYFVVGKRTGWGRERGNINCVTGE